MRAEIEVNDCLDCPFNHHHYGHGECWNECIHPKNNKKAYENILYGCQEAFKSIPKWCPINEPQAQE